MARHALEAPESLSPQEFTSLLAERYSLGHLRTLVTQMLYELARLHGITVTEERQRWGL